MGDRGRSADLPGVVPWVGCGITKPPLTGWQKSDELDSNEAATDESWRQVGGERAVSEGALVYRSLKGTDGLPGRRV